MRAALLPLLAISISRASFAGGLYRRENVVNPGGYRNAHLRPQRLPGARAIDISAANSTSR
jgi:hypothetical protein